jgi:hypothetical protein
MYSTEILSESEHPNDTSFLKAQGSIMKANGLIGDGMG